MNLHQRRFRLRGRIVQRALAVSLMALLLPFSALPAFAQTETGQITVKVTDPQGAIIPGATVTVRSVDRGTTLPAVTTSDEGTATITSLQPGLYEVTVATTGFTNFVQQAQVTVGARLTVEAKMTAAGQSEVVN